MPKFMSELVRFITPVVVLTLAACATPVIMLKNDQTGEVARCGGTNGFRGTAIAVDAVVPRSDEQCVRDYQAQGFRRTSEAMELMRNPAPYSGSAGGAPASTQPVSAGESKWLIAAEGAARSNGCASPLVTMTSKGAGAELFAAQCAGGVTMSLRCEVEGCRILR